MAEPNLKDFLEKKRAAQKAEKRREEEEALKRALDSASDNRGADTADTADAKAGTEASAPGGGSGDSDAGTGAGAGARNGADGGGDAGDGGGVPPRDYQQEIHALVSAMRALQNELDEAKDQAHRAKADYQNSERRHKTQVEEAKKFGAVNLIKDLLDVADNLDRTLAAIPAGEADTNESLRRLKEGVELTSKFLTAVFNRHGVKKVDPVGEKFDPRYHEALMQVETDKAAGGMIVEVAQSGYTQHDRLLRPAKVIVAKNSGGKGPSAPGA